MFHYGTVDLLSYNNIEKQEFRLRLPLPFAQGLITVYSVYDLTLKMYMAVRPKWLEDFSHFSVIMFHIFSLSETETVIEIEIETFIQF